VNLFLSASPDYRLFISHAWDYKSEYDGVVNLLNSDWTFKWTNLSVPVDSPLPVSMVLPKSHRNIVRQLDDKIRQADCLLVLAAMYVAHRGWIQSEIEAALEFKKPIVAIKPRGQERVPEALRQAAITDPVGWNSSSIISAIRMYATPGQPMTLASLAGLGQPPPSTLADQMSNLLLLGEKPTSLPAGGNATLGDIMRNLGLPPTGLPKK
jgi:hypothetical protein